MHMFLEGRTGLENVCFYLLIYGKIQIPLGNQYETMHASISAVLDFLVQ